MPVKMGCFEFLLMEYTTIDAKLHRTMGDIWKFAESYRIDNKVTYQISSFNIKPIKSYCGIACVTIIFVLGKTLNPFE